jgi:hypothetical protein
MVNGQIKSPYKLVAVKFQRHYPGYIYRREIIDDSDYGGDGKLEMVNCYSDETGHWIGDARTAKAICKDYGLRQVQKRTKESCVATIGFQPEEKKWYGWSHRAIAGFKTRKAAERFAESVS